MSGGSLVVRRAHLGVRSSAPTRSRVTREPGAHGKHLPLGAPAHRAAPRRRRGVAVVGVLAALGGATVATFLLQPVGGLNPGAGPGSARADLDTRSVSVAAGVTCWDGTSAARARECGLPSGRAGLATVFPSLDATCARTTPVVGGKVEVFTCRGSDYVIRYARWQPGFDRFAVFGEVHHGVGSKWVVAREFAGRRWASREQTTDGMRHFRWTATYRAQPFSVEVRSASLAGRSAGMAAVDVVAARLLGRS